MRIGLIVHWPGLGLDERLDQLLRRCERAEADGFASLWSAHLPNSSYDALTVLALAGTVTTRVELGTAVVPTYPRHPIALAQQALTVQAATANRLTLGIGLSHRAVIEQAFGLDYSRPVGHMREYLALLAPLLAGEPVDVAGKEYRVHTRLRVPETAPPQILVAGLGPQMLALAGAMAGGTIVAFGGARYLSQAVPPLRVAAAAAGRPAPRVAACFPVAVTNDRAAVQEAANQTFARYAMVPSYRRNLDIEGSPDASGGTLIGSETDIDGQIQRLAELGVTDLLISPFAVAAVPVTVERTYEYLASLARARGAGETKVATKQADGSRDT